MGFDALTLTQVVAMMFIMMMGGFALLTAFIMGELNHIKQVIAIILAANPKLAKKVDEFTESEKIIKIKDDGNNLSKGIKFKTGD